MIKGTIKFDGLALGELNITFLEGLRISATAAFINSKTGATHGSTKKHGQWSTATLAAVRELRAAIEQDIAKSHLDDVDASAPKGDPLFDDASSFFDADALNDAFG